MQTGISYLSFKEELTLPFTDTGRYRELASARFEQSLENLGGLIVDGVNQNRLVGAEAAALAGLVLALGSDSPDPPSRNSPGRGGGGSGTYGKVPLPERQRSRRR